MIRIALVEDEAEVRAQLQGYVQRHTRQYGTEFAVTEFADGMELLDDYRPVYDILFLDVEMKHLDGMETARRVRELDKDGKLNGDVIDGILSQEKKEVDKVIINSAELEKYFGKEVTPAKMKEQIMSLLDDWKEKQPPELAKAPKKQELDK